jgi:hypothetical protein
VPDSGLRERVRAALHPPLWARWVLTILGFAVLIVAIGIVVRSNDGGGGGGVSGSAKSEAQAEAEAEHEGRIVVGQDQAPHVAPLRSGVAAEVALERAITIDVNGRIADGELTGPLQSVRCQASGPQSHAGRRWPFRCTVRSAGIAYPFLGVLDERARELTWCKVDPPPEAGAPQEVPVSSRCRA